MHKSNSNFDMKNSNSKKYRTWIPKITKLDVVYVIYLENNNFLIYTWFYNTYVNKENDESFPVLLINERLLVA